MLGLDPTTTKLLIMLASVVASNWAAVYVIKAHLKHTDKRTEKNEENIETLFSETRYVMTGNDIRRLIHEEVGPVKAKVDIINNVVIAMKATQRDPAIRTRGSDERD